MKLFKGLVGVFLGNLDEEQTYMIANTVVKHLGCHTSAKSFASESYCRAVILKSESSSSIYL